MELTQTLSEGLKREFKVVYPVAEVEERLTKEIDQLKGRIRLNGFRPGKVPAAHLRKMYGRSLVGEMLDKVSNEAKDKILEENSFRLAVPPRFEFPQEKEDIEQMLDVKSDLVFSVKFELLPEVDIVDVSDVKLTRETAEIADDEIRRTQEYFVRAAREYHDKDGASANGDRMIIDYVGTVDGEEFEGGSAENQDLVLGSASFIPGFEEKLTGLKAGEETTFEITFPAEYRESELAGQKAEFRVKVRNVQETNDKEITDEMAKKGGWDSAEALHASVRKLLEEQYNQQSRRRIKKKLVDVLDERYSFELPESLVEQEFNEIWQQVLQDLKNSNRTFEDEGTTEEAAKADYRKIAVRRVRLGLVLAQIGEKAGVTVTEDELSKALMAHVTQHYRGREKEAWDYYAKSPAAMAQIRAPIFEEKVIDHVLSGMTVEDVVVSKEELFKDDDEVVSSSTEPKSADEQAGETAAASQEEVSADAAPHDEKKVPKTKKAAKPEAETEAAAVEKPAAKPKARKTPAKPKSESGDAEEKKS
jgi:trigger factor